MRGARGTQQGASVAAQVPSAPSSVGIGVADFVACLVTEGFELALEGKKRKEPPTPPKLDGAREAKLIAMRLGKPPAGYGHWTLQLLADELVALEVVDSISHETVRKVLKKMA